MHITKVPYYPFHVFFCVCLCRHFAWWWLSLGNRLLSARKRVSENSDSIACTMLGKSCRRHDDTAQINPPLTNNRRIWIFNFFCLLLRPFFPPFAKINISDGVGKTEIKHKKISNCDLEWNCHSEENRSFLLSARLQIVAVRNQMKTFLLAFVYKSRHPTDESVLLYCLRQQLSRASEKCWWH